MKNAIKHKFLLVGFAIILPLTVFGQQAKEETHREQQRVMLEKIHTREMARLNAIKTVAVQRESKDLVKQMEKLIADATTRHEEALKVLEEPNAKKEEKEEDK